MHILLFAGCASLLGFGVSSDIRAQDSGLRAMHVRAPEFPPPSSPAAQTIAGPGIPSPQALPPTATVSPSGPGGMATSPSGIQPVGGPPNSIRGVTWINSPPLTMKELRGKVVMIDFWDYTCINCIRTFPENRKLWDRYHRDGFVLIGVEDAEFSSAAPVERAREAVKRFGLPYPNVVDADFQIWNAYANHFWPNVFLIDAYGYIRYNHPGEGAENEIERAIQELLKEARPGQEFPGSNSLTADADASAPGCGGATTPEMYVGDWSGRGVLANPEGYHDHKTVEYSRQDTVEDGRVSLTGRWETARDGMIYRGKHKGDEPGEDRAILEYHARELYSVMNLARGRETRLYVMQDGKYLTAGNKGADVEIDSKGRSYIEVRTPRMYYLVQNSHFGSHRVELYPAADGLMINSFTFGNDCQTDFEHL